MNRFIWLRKKQIVRLVASCLALTSALLVLPVESSATDDAGAMKVIEELQQLEETYNDVSLKGRESTKSDFVSSLLANLGHQSRAVRRRATYLVNVYFADDPQVLASLLDFLEPGRFSELQVQARINVMHLIGEASEDAWTLESLDRARDRVEKIRAAPPDGWAPQQMEYFATLDKRIAELADLPDSVWAFRTIQERNVETAGLTDIDVFVCEESSEDIEVVDRARRLSALLAEREFGRVRLRIWPAENETPPNGLRPYSSVVFDAKHPEEKEVPRVEDALIEVGGLPPSRLLPNEGQPTPWYLSVIICP